MAYRVDVEEERIALFLDFENLAIGARENNLGTPFDLKPVADALAERGRTVVRRAYADWSSFSEDRRALTRHHVELIEIPQRMGTVRKNAADIKLAVDALELSFSAPYITTFVIGTGDSDFTPLVHKLRERNKMVIGLGIEGSTSELLPPACDEFLFYDRLDGVGPGRPQRRTRRVKEREEVEEAEEAEETTSGEGEEADLSVLITQTLSGLKRRAGDTVLSSQLKRTLLRKDPTFDEASFGFRSFSELMRHLETQGAVQLSEGSAKGDPEVDFPEGVSHDEDAAFKLLAEVIASVAGPGGAAPLSGLKNQLRKQLPGFTEKRFGYGGFLQFCKAARTRGLIEMEWDAEMDDYALRPAS